jgi:hypothetical protein
VGGARHNLAGHLLPVMPAVCFDHAAATLAKGGLLAALLPGAGRAVGFAPCLTFSFLYKIVLWWLMKAYTGALQMAVNGRLARAARVLSDAARAYWHVVGVVGTS